MLSGAERAKQIFSFVSGFFPLYRFSVSRHRLLFFYPARLTPDLSRERSRKELIAPFTHSYFIPVFYYHFLKRTLVSRGRRRRATRFIIHQARRPSSRERFLYFLQHYLKSKSRCRVPLHRAVRERKQSRLPSELNRTGAAQ